MQADAYKILGIDSGADTESIRKAFRALVKEWHPDVNDSPEAPEQFRKISDAFETLMDPERKRIHDLQHGYHKKNIPKGEQQKFFISESRSEKAKQTVNQWKQDYSTVMQAREMARLREVMRHRRAMRRARLIMAVVLVIIGWTIWALTR